MITNKANVRGLPNIFDCSLEYFLCSPPQYSRRPNKEYCKTEPGCGPVSRKWLGNSQTVLPDLHNQWFTKYDFYKK